MKDGKWKAELYTNFNATELTFDIIELGEAESRPKLMSLLENIENGKYCMYEFYDDTNELVVHEDGIEDDEGYGYQSEGIHISRVED